MSWRELVRESVRALPAPRSHNHAAHGQGLARLDLNDAPLQPDATEMAMFQNELAKLELNRYPEADGRLLREQLAQLWKISADEILLGSGSAEIVGMLMTMFGAARAGRQAVVIHPEPTWGQYDFMAHGYGLRSVPVPLDEQFALDEKRVAEVITRERPALAFYPTPNSPTGRSLPLAALDRLARHMQGVFVVDEAYADFAAESLLPRVRKTPGLFVMRSFSKIGFAGLRVGALVGDREAIAEINKVRRPFNISSVSLAFAHALLADPSRLSSRIAAIVRLRCQLEAELRTIEGVEVFPSRASFLLIRTPFPASSVFDGLLARNVLVRVFEPSPRLDRCLRITAGSIYDNARCVHALRETLASLSAEPARPHSHNGVTGNGSCDSVESSTC